MSQVMIVTEFTETAHRLLDMLRQGRPLMKAEQQRIDSVLCVLRMEWDYWKTRQEAQAQAQGNKGHTSAE